MARKTPAAETPPLTFEEQMQRLQVIVQELERADLPLETNVALYREGRALARACQKLLEEARNEIRLAGADGGDLPFDPSAAETAE